jgi:cold shock CspA family protein
MDMGRDGGLPREGRLVRWDQNKGFGFIRPDDGDKDVVVHVSGLAHGSLPEIGSRWVFSAGEDPNGRGLRVIKAVPVRAGDGAGAPGRRRAEATMRAGAPRRPANREPRQPSRSRPPGQSAARPSRRRDQSLRPLPLDWRTGLVAVATLFCLAAAATRFGTRGWLLAVYPSMSLVAYLMYARDKLSAIRGTWRVPESSLHLAELLGGWPGAYVAQ